MFIEILLYGVFAAAMVVAAVEAYQKRKKFLRLRSLLTHQQEELKKRVSALYDMTNILNAHAGNYFSALNDAGFSRLMELREDLKNAVEDCEFLIAQQQLGDARRILRFLLTPGQKEPPILRNPINADLSDLVGWESTSNDILLRCAIQLNESSSTTDRLGIVRPGKRRRTYHTLEILREMLPK